MIIQATAIDGVRLLVADQSADERGFFARLYDPDEFAAAGLPVLGSQISLSHNAGAATLRGLHLQRSPHSEAKLVRCMRGSVFDVAVDLRPDSPTFRSWTAASLSRGAMNALFIPEGCAHGFITLEPDTDVMYQMSVPHAPGSAAGVRWNDPVIGVEWPVEPAVISPRDRELPLLADVEL